MSSEFYPFTQSSGIETLAQYLERLVAVKASNDRYNHTLDCRKVESSLSSARIQCPCGNRIKVTLQYYAGASVCACPSCGYWHTVLYIGPKSPEDGMEDQRIEWEIRGPEISAERPKVGAIKRIGAFFGLDT